jgi:glycerol transport system ATP-binding protein
VRPEYTKLSDKDGLPVRIRRVEDVGRHKIVRAEFFGNDLNIIAKEGEPIGTDMTRVIFDPVRVNVYANDWRVTGEAA